MEGSNICNRALLTLTKGQMILKTITGSRLLCALNNNSKVVFQSLLIMPIVYYN